MPTLYTSQDYTAKQDIHGQFVDVCKIYIWMQKIQIYVD